MTDEFENAETTHRIEGTDDLLMSVIKDQAANLEHGWREGIQNGVDSPGSSLVTLDFDHEHTVIQDDGEGVDLSVDRGIALLTNLGESSKRDDENTIGQFGIGKGQIVAKGKTTFKSGDQALIFDIENHGLEVAQRTLEEPVSGLRVEVEHYPSEVPSEGSFKWNTYERRIRKRFRYVSLATGVDVEINGEPVNGQDPEEVAEKYTYNVYEEFGNEDTGPVYIAVGQSASDPLSVYSRGVKVKDVNSRGLGGVIVTERNLALNFARNDIQSGCPLWKAINDRLNEIRIELFEEIPDNRLTRDARTFLANEMLQGVENGDFTALNRFSGKRVFRTANESHISVDQISEKAQIGFADSGDPAADKLNEAYGMTILDQGDEAVDRFRQLSSSLSEQINIPDSFDPREKAEELGMFKANSYIPDEELSPNRRKRLAVARHIADRMDFDREIYYGESDLANAWTDGHSEIVITDDCMPSGNRLAWMPELFETLVHEYSHDESTIEGCADHGRFFDESYRKNMERMWPEFSQFMAEAARTSVKDLVGF